MHIGLKIRDLRKKKGFTQTYLSSMIGMDNSQLSKIEKGKLMPTVEQIMAISSIFGISADWLMEKDDANNISQKVRGNNNIITGQNANNNKDDIIFNLQQQLIDYKNIIKEKDQQINKLLEVISKLS